MFILISVITKEVVKAFSCKQDAEKYLFFYDSLETPHYLDFVKK